MDKWPPTNLVHIALAELDPDMLTSQDGKQVQVSLEAIRQLLADPPLILCRPGKQ